MRNVIGRLYRTKLLLSCIVLVVVGGSLIAVGRQLDHSQTLRWLQVLPWTEIGGILVGAGLFSVWLNHFLQDEQRAVDDLRLRQMLQEHAPAMRDAVLEAFAANHDDLARVATPETLDRIIVNSLALRLKDPQFASEVYTDIRDQAILATERWHDASLSIELSPHALMPPVASAGHFAVTVRREYTTVPQHAQRRFVCLSDREEYVELANQRGDTSAWYLKPTGGVDASSPEAFELLRFTVDGQDQPIRRAFRKKGQIYTARIGIDHVAAGQPVTIAYTYRTITKRSGHLLFFEVEQPTRDLRVDFDYGGCGVASVSTLDLIPSVRRSRIELAPPGTSGNTVRFDVDGWIFPRSGVAFVWTLDSEIKNDDHEQRITTLENA